MGFVVVACGEEIELFSVTAELGRPGGDLVGRHGDGLATLGRSHPDACVCTILFEVLGCDGIGYPFAVVGKSGASDLLDSKGVVNFQVSQ